MVEPGLRGCLLNLSLLDALLWAAGFICNAALLSVLIYKRRYGTIPWFTAWISFGIVYTITLFVAFRVGTKHVYAVLYWSGAFLDLLLQLAVVFEIATYVFRRGQCWVEGAKGRFAIMGVSAPLLAGLLAWQMTPAATSALDSWESRDSLFTTVVICILFSAVMVVSQQVGVSWRDLVLREGYGVIGMAVVAFVTDTLHAYWRTIEHFSQLENVRMVAYLGTLVYWMVIFWLPERGMTSVDASINKRLEALRRELE